MTDNTYNGWTNWHTFTIGSNLMNDEGLYLNGVSVFDRNLDLTELDEVIQEINA